MNKKIKIIDLLNKIANGEELPENIKYHNRNLKEADIMLCCKENIIDKLDCNSIYLNDEVEIIEDKIDSIEKIKTLKYDTFNKKQKLLYENICTLANKLNEVIDKINEMENNK